MLQAPSRRTFLAAGAATFMAGNAGAAELVRLPAPSIDKALLRRALAAMGQHTAKLMATDRIAIVDFARASSEPRLHLVDLTRASVRSVLVAHGRGSDPGYTGWLTRFSNVPGSYASSEGSYVTGADYVGAHGQSLRLEGLDETNSNAEERAIVIHAAWYVDKSRAETVGKIGRSEGCFAVSQTSLDPVLAHLGSGRFLYADKIGLKSHKSA